MRSGVLSIGIVFLSILAFSQSNFQQPNFSTSGGVFSSNTTQRVYAVIGQPIAINNINRTQSQAGFLQVADYVVIDAIPPSIIFTDGTQKINKQALPTFSTVITDNISVTSAKIFYRKISDQTWSSSNLTKNGNSYSVPIQSNWFDAMGMEYYFEASDARPNIKRDPSIGSYFAYLSSSEETIPSERFGFGTQTVDYKIISFPYETSNNSVTSLFNEFGSFSNTKWRMASYNNASDSFIEYPAFTSLSRGTGYWILVKTPIDVTIGPVDSPEENRSNLFEMTLKPGWNLIGNPYPVSIDWSDVRAFNNNTSLGEIKVYNRGFTNGDIINAYQGGFVFLDGDSDVDIKIPFVGQLSESTRKSELFSNDIDEDKWLINLTLEQSGVRYQLGGFGMHPNASFKADQFDDYNPPSFLNSPEINFPHPEHKLGNFCRDVLPLHNEAIWSFTVKGEVGRKMNVSWNPFLFTNNRELYLFDEQNLNVIDLKTLSNYDFTLFENHSFKVYFGESIREKIVSNSISLLPPFPNPISKHDKLTFKVALPENNILNSVDIRILTSAGISVGSLSKKLSSGIHEVTIDINKDNVTSGIYYYRVGVETSNGIKIFTGKLIIL